MTWKELGITKYQQYFKTRHWLNLKEQLIFSNEKARCWICGGMSTLLLHHVSYENLGREKLLYDVFILCFSCHTQVHFWGFGSWKTKLTPADLLRRMYFLKSKYCFQRKHYIRSAFYFIPSLLY